MENVFIFNITADWQFLFNSQERKYPASETKTFYIVFIQDFVQWVKKKIAHLDLYSWHGEYQYFKYFWYDTVERKVYYFEFDLYCIGNKPHNCFISIIFLFSKQQFFRNIDLALAFKSESNERSDRNIFQKKKGSSICRRFTIFRFSWSFDPMGCFEFSIPGRF